MPNIDLHIRNLKELFILFFCLICFPIQAANDTRGDLENATEEGISGNPSVANLDIGTGKLGKAMGFTEDSGVRVGALVIQDYSYLIDGGVSPHKGGLNSVLMLGLNLDTGKLKLWKDGLFCLTLLQFNGRPVNNYAGAIQGYDSLYALNPLDRFEVYQLWFRQDLFNNKLIIRIGKMVTSYDFGNVLRPYAFREKDLNIPATTGLTYNSVFINSTALGTQPGFYNSAYGITVTYCPTDSCYLSYGGYDGNLARRKNTGMRGPQFNGYYYHIGEAGCGWVVKKLPGNLSIGGWYQSGKLETTTLVKERGASGLYLFGTQRLWRRRPGVDNSGIVAFIQMGINKSKTQPMNQFLSGGLTFFGLVPCRNDDSFGLGASWAKLNKRIFARPSEIMYQIYYQMFLWEDVYFTTSLNYIPDPGAGPDVPAATAITGRLIAIF